MGAALRTALLGVAGLAALSGAAWRGAAFLVGVATLALEGVGVFIKILTKLTVHTVYTVAVMSASMAGRNTHQAFAGTAVQTFNPFEPVSPSRF